jgi:hypothetical protein
MNGLKVKTNLKSGRNNGVNSGNNLKNCFCDENGEAWCKERGQLVPTTAISCVQPVT